MNRSIPGAKGSPLPALGHCLGLLGVFLVALVMTLPAPADAQDSTRLVEGTITYIAPNAVEVDGVRGLIGRGSSVVSAGRAVGIRSIRRGMPARLELDSAGRVLELRVMGVVE